MRPTDGEHRAALSGHASRVERYRRGEMSDDEFRPVRLSYGLYYQLDHTSHMQRIKLPAGLLTPSQARELADVGDEYGRGVIHVTTREDVQIHWVDLGKVIEIYQRLHAVGITTRGACADSVRNVTGCIHAGTWPGELFDVTPYALAVHEYFLFHPLNLTQPRKFKIAFATCEYDCVQSRINEIAYFPKVRDGRKGFSVYAAGGLGSQPHLAQLVREFIPAEDVLIMTEAIVRLQHRSGERKNRKRARMKYLYQRWGAERFVREVDAQVALVEEQQGDALRAELTEIVSEFHPSVPSRPAAAPPKVKDAELAHWLRTNTYAQRQEGYFGATVQLPLGDITGEQLRAVVGLAEQYGSGEMRAANDQNLMIPWIPGNQLEAVYERLKQIGLSAADALHITDVTACPGADYCSLAMSRSMGVATKIRNHLLATNGEVEELGVFRIKISGCPNACGQHYVGDIGLTGLSLKGDHGQFEPHYSMLIGGGLGEDASLGKRVSGRFPADEVPKVVAALADYFRQQRVKGERFAAFVDRVGAERLTEVARQAAAVVH